MYREIYYADKDCREYRNITVYVNKIIRSKEPIMNKTFLAMMEDLGFDVELNYVERKET